VLSGRFGVARTGSNEGIGQRPTHARLGPAESLDVPLGTELLVRLHRGAARHAQIGGELTGRWQSRTGGEPAVENALADVTVDLAIQRVSGLLIDRDGKDASAARARRHRVTPIEDAAKLVWRVHTRKESGTGPLLLRG
jgi:hypothetical protein